MLARRYVPPSYIGTIFVALGDNGQAFEWLGRACEDHSYDILYLNVDPLFESLRRDPRFADLLRRANLADVK